MKTPRRRGPGKFLESLTPEQRADYNLLLKQKYTSAEALKAIGRADLLEGKK